MWKRTKGLYNFYSCHLHFILFVNQFSQQGLYQIRYDSRTECSLMSVVLDVYQSHEILFRVTPVSEEKWLLPYDCWSSLKFISALFTFSSNFLKCQAKNVVMPV